MAASSWFGEKTVSSATRLFRAFGGSKARAQCQPSCRGGPRRVSARGSELWDSSQACLSLAIPGSGLTMRTLSAPHNFPHHLFDPIPAEQQRLPLSIVNYHDVFTRHGAQSAAQRNGGCSRRYPPLAGSQG
ncbi:hypothetical protein N7E70_026485 [Aminobacter sp. NyZ550]|jgi:hypothetical protein|uniref:hypothetical protein n=1 Tax=unclassified Aminobacter TaxID=2644704 RepID=UPI0022B24E19|nr:MULTISPECIES: hypothetical protein [unclassified Aminobacter]WAX95148.1 hypothetical protein N7E70_026485 [Aminobacter sp. NyZ550]